MLQLNNIDLHSPKAAYLIWEQAQKTDRNDLRIEDMFFLGILRKKAGIPENRVFGMHSNLWEDHPSNNMIRERGLDIINTASKKLSLIFYL